MKNFDYNNLAHPDYDNDARWTIELNAAEVWLLRHLLEQVPPGTESVGQAGFILHDLEQEPTSVQPLWTEAR